MRCSKSYFYCLARLIYSLYIRSHNIPVFLASCFPTTKGIRDQTTLIIDCSFFLFFITLFSAAVVGPTTFLTILCFFLKETVFFMVHILLYLLYNHPIFLVFNYQSFIYLFLILCSIYKEHTMKFCFYFFRFS